MKSNTEEHKTFRFDKERNDTGKTAYLSKGYIAEVQEGIYQAYRTVMLEDPKTGKLTDTGTARPWGKPMVIAEVGDPIVSHTQHPVTGEAIPLTPLEPELRAGALASKNYEVKRKDK